ncbi:hypothetical protein D3P08_17245 [Paenibacillus nanensis]|uniref:Gfo/Idh/MocA family oxidoreductase n=1 Tax=Paenibacillus nanensis TaxID=393251 RepID=A0A3A1URU0_9BACL|nr:carbohydrate-binding family 9-like protein [Paenibacillus nanensis]RIX51217.1 hypothetical protein D3P08_17245 [Paenibacillus nanensis]
MTYRVAIAGCGGIADRHLNAIKIIERQSGRVQAVAAADLNEARIAEAQERYGSELKGYNDYKQMIKEVRPDIVIITLPHFLHHEAACFAAEAGCHILLEKPMAMNAAECDAIIEQAGRRGISVLVGHTQHYIAENMQAKKIIEDGALGRLLMLHDVRHTDYEAGGRPDWFFRKSMSGGGIAFNLGSHSVDKAVWLAGSPVASVQANMSFHGRRGDVDGSVSAYLRLTNGVSATIVQSGYKAAAANYTELLFTNGSLRLESGRALYRSDGGPYELLEKHDSADPFVLQLEDLMQAIETGHSPSCTMDYAKHIIEVVEGMYLSHQSGREEQIGGGGLPNAKEPTLIVQPASAGTHGAWENDRDGSELAVRHYKWMPAHHAIKVRAALSYTPDELQISFRAYEDSPLIRFTRHNDMVYKDSCVECFLQPAPHADARYLNLEMNAAGTLRIGIGTGRHDRDYLELEDLPPMHIRTELGLRDEATGETYWTARLRIPMKWLESLFPDFRPVPGAKLRANFYKCGDETSRPHYGSWSAVYSDTPDFHLSEDFGWLLLG